MEVSGNCTFGMNSLILAHVVCRFCENCGQASRACDSSPILLAPWPKQNLQNLWLRSTAGLKKRPVSTSSLCEESINFKIVLLSSNRQVALHTSAIPNDGWTKSRKVYFEVSELSCINISCSQYVRAASLKSSSFPIIFFWVHPFNCTTSPSFWRNLILIKASTISVTHQLL